MMNPFRFAEEDPEVRKTRIHEEEETKRHAISQREKARSEIVARHEETKQVALKERDTPGYVVPRLIAGVVSVGITIAGYQAFTSWLETRTPAACYEESFNMHTYTNPKCGSKMAEGRIDGEQFVCKCPARSEPKPTP